MVLRVLVLRECSAYVAQALEHDITAQDESRSGAMDCLIATIRDHCADRLLPAPAPAWYVRKFNALRPGRGREQYERAWLVGSLDDRGAYDPVIFLAKAPTGAEIAYGRRLARTLRE